ncbi:hypothetical protein QBC44DRAFT_230201 [Cladorrhinum sp. PSN332]|nr:hypothetical protein QBC44DRAFT_230201 [Cladorrhinum sp. PSN332]
MAGIDSLPVEIIVEIASNLDFASFDALLSVNKQLRSVLGTHWGVILAEIIRDEFAPYDGFLHAFEGQVTSKHGANRSLSKVEGGLQSVLNFCRVVKLWEGEFQRLKFFDLPAEQCRSFLQDELRRLREGLYIWRRYALHFHAGERNGNVVWCGDCEDRYRFMRQFSSGELSEVCDVWRVVKAAVGREVCPSVEKVIEQSGNMLSIAEAERIGWGEGTENDHVRATILRLLPEDILHLLLYRHRYASKTSVIQFARMRNPWIEDGTETLSSALVSVRDEWEDISGHGEGVNLCDWVDGGGSYFKRMGFRYDQYETGSVRKGRLDPRRY